jgi:hypothetical protein
MRRQSEYSARTMFGYVAFTSVAIFLMLLAIGHTGIELFVMLALVLTLTGLQGLIDKFLFDKYRQ